MCIIEKHAELLPVLIIGLQDLPSSMSTEVSEEDDESEYVVSVSDHNNNTYIFMSLLHH